MGWGTSFKAEIYLSRQVFNSKLELDERIKELEGYIESAKRELTAYAVATPRDIIAEKDESGYTQNPIDELLRKVHETFEWMEDNYRDLNKLYQYQEYLEENPDIDIKQFSDI
jgi:Na+/phosphate symporter